jgi:hypothetical protein
LARAASPEFEAAVSDSTAATICYFSGLEDLIAQYDRDCDDAVAREDYDKAEELAAIQENLRRVAALNPQPNAKAVLEAFVVDIGDLNDRVEELRAAAHAKEAEMMEQEKMHAAKKQFAKAKECKDARAAAIADGEKSADELRVFSAVPQFLWLHSLLPRRCSWAASRPC